jgi:hypothetical protein
VANVATEGLALVAEVAASCHGHTFQQLAGLWPGKLRLPHIVPGRG